MHLSISPELERLIAEQGKALGYSSPEEYLRVVFGDAGSDVAPQLSDEAFQQVLDELGSDQNLPSLPADFSRADLYDDHD